MPIVPVGSLPLFAFANDGTMAWLRASGPRLLAVDPKTGVVLREVRLDPAPFGIAWHVERHGDVFVVRDDREIAAYEGASGTRLWKRTWPTKIAILGEREGGKRVSVAPGPMGVDVVEADLATGAFDPKLRVAGTMDHVGANGVVAGGMLFFATDQRDAWAVSLDGYRVAERHELGGSQVLPPVLTAGGVHVAVVHETRGGAVTRVTTLDRASGGLVRTDEFPGRAHALAAGASGLLLDVVKPTSGKTERVAFRPDAPHLRLVAAARVELNVLPNPKAHEVEILGIRPTPKPGDEIVPPAGRFHDPLRGPHEAYRALLAELGAESRVLSRLADAVEALADSDALASLGVRFRDPRVRWAAAPGRDPSLLEVARLGDGDALATYLYPPAKGGRVPLVRVSSADTSAHWLSSDIDAWLAAHLHEARASAPERVAAALATLGLGDDFPRPLAPEQREPPTWFFEAHGTPWRTSDAERALADGDLLGAERMLISTARRGAHAAAKEPLLSIYAMLGWEHHRAVVAETW